MERTEKGRSFIATPSLLLLLLHDSGVSVIMQECSAETLPNYPPGCSFVFAHFTAVKFKI